MPYRRLPNTDQARLRALKAALTKAAREIPDNLLFSQKLKLEVSAFLPVFEQSVTQYINAKELQASHGRSLAAAFKNARLYLSHFVQVFNMCVQRGEIKPEQRKLLGLSDATTMPDMNTEAQLLECGAKIITGEEQRMSSGNGNRIYNPSIAVVKVKYEQFKEIYHKHKDLIVTAQKHQEKVSEMREKANRIILELWNEVEGSFGIVDTDEKRDICIDYGIVYFYRPHEKTESATTYPAE
jgi:hypothetical protein